MTDHQKPTKEELEENIRKSQEELAKLETPEPTPSKPVPTPSEEIPEPSESIPTPSEEVPEPTPSKPIEKEEKKEEKSTEDYKKKFTESTREAQVLYAKEKKIQEAITAASELPEPTEEEMKKEFSDWEDMSITEKRLTKDNIWNKRKFDAIAQASQEGKNIDAWNEKVDTYMDDPKVLIKHPELEGKVEDFKVFATKPTRRGVDFDDLILAFNGELIKNRPAKKKGQMFEQGTSGTINTPKPKDDKLSVVEGRTLMHTNYKKYVELLKAGKIKNE